MDDENYDLKEALGSESSGEEKTEYKGKLKHKPAAYLQLLEDAVDDDLSKEERMEALCHAIEYAQGFHNSNEKCD